MKKFYLLFLVVCGFAANAQVTYNPGLRAGANFSHYSGSTDNFFFWDNWYSSPTPTSFKSRTDFYVGFQGNIRFTKYYGLQPEIVYSRQGSKVESEGKNGEIKVSYLSLQMVNKFYMDKFNIHAGPTIDFVVDKNTNINDGETDLGFLLGVGYDITENIGIEGRVKRGIIPVFSYDGNHSNVVFQAGVYYTFKLKQ